MLWYLVAFVVALAFSALFSGSETALFSLTPGARESLHTHHPAASARIERLLANPARLLGTILLGNLIVNTTASALATLVALELARRGHASAALFVGLGGLAATAAIVVFGEVLPKLSAGRSPAGFSRLIVPVISILEPLLRPGVRLFTRASAWLAPRTHEPEALTDDELHTMVEIGRKRGVIAPGEEEILTNLIGLEDRTVAEVMTPRIDVMAVPETATVADALRRARELGFSRLPVYRGNKDTIVGSLHVKELLAAPDPQALVTSQLRPPFFVPQVKRLTELLDELRRKGSHIAVVVDEFGQTAGIVTLEDLLEAVFGEITDEHDVAEELPYSKVDDNSYLVDGEIDIATLNRLFRNAFRKLEHERLASFIHDELGRLPREGDSLRHGRLEIRVEKIDGLKLEKVLVARRAK